jgi:hypothetical protein
MLVNGKIFILNNTLQEMDIRAAFGNADSLGMMKPMVC